MVAPAAAWRPATLPRPHSPRSTLTQNIITILVTQPEKDLTQGGPALHGTNEQEAAVKRQKQPKPATRRPGTRQQQLGSQTVGARASDGGAVAVYK
ncbi:hypothetical protein Hamer_G004837 [Homarus americanus]|uniref:Uncharacterized protein n=1 Tax=Homarus americanus TaxID=6706 RepID=A0A8J5K0E8_HOMAM|nr:hypothetical protein Hamer_G004837 [Homarus americanus]